MCPFLNVCVETFQLHLIVIASQKHLICYILALRPVSNASCHSIINQILQPDGAMFVSSIKFQLIINTQDLTTNFLFFFKLLIQLFIISQTIFPSKLFPNPVIRYPITNSIISAHNVSDSFLFCGDISQMKTMIKPVCKHYINAKKKDIRHTQPGLLE